MTKSNVIKRILASALLITSIFITSTMVANAAPTWKFGDEVGVSDFLLDKINKGEITRTGSEFVRKWYSGDDDFGKTANTYTLTLIDKYKAHYAPDGSTIGAQVKTDSGSYSTFSVSQPYNFAIEQFVNPGQHTYLYQMPVGSVLPVGQWTTEYSFPSYPCCHHEGFIENNFFVGRWGEYLGVTYHSVSGTLASENEIASSCNVNGANRWFPRCAVCGEILSNCHFLATDSALRSLKYLTIGDAVINLCSYCGGMEATGSISHKCKAVSDNRYHIEFNIGTNDPNAYGTQSSLTWYHNYNPITGEAEYEHQSVTGATNIPATTNYIRPGYTFKGWSYSKNGAVLALNTELEKIERDFNYPENDTVITLYAVWKAEESTVTIDANSENNWNETAKVLNKTSYSETKTFQTGRVKGKDNLALDNANNFTPNSITIDIAADVTLPVGYTLSFNSNGGVTKDYNNGNNISTLSAPITCVGYKQSSVCASPLYTVSSTNGGLVNASYDAKGNITKLTYTYNGAPYKDTITLQYKQGSVKLPSCSKPNYLFTGWYTTPDFKDGTYIGTTGDYYFPTENITVYARFSEMNIEITDAYYKATSDPVSYNNLAVLANGLPDNAFAYPSSDLAINNAKGAFYLRNKMFVGGGNNLVYETYYRLSGTNDPFVKLDGNWQEEGSTATSLNKQFTEAGTYTYEVLSTGYYTLTVDGAQGQNYGSYKGGKGGEVSGIYFLKKGDTLTVKVGGLNEQGKHSNTIITATSGGDLSSITKTHDGTDTLLLMAGGGGAAGSLSNGKDGGNTDTSLLTTVSLGKEGVSAGGSGYLGGINGTYTVHTHGSNTGSNGINTVYYYDGTNTTVTTRACYTRHQGTIHHGCPGHGVSPSYSYSYPVDNQTGCPYGSAGATPGTHTHTTVTYKWTDCSGHVHDGCEYWSWSCSHSGGGGSGHPSVEYCGGWNESYDYWALDNCPYRNSGDNFVISSEGAYGGSNYTATDGAITSSVTSLSGKREGIGLVDISAYNVSLRSGKDNEAFDVFYTSDKTAPEAIDITLTVKGSTEYVVVEKEPDSGRTNYDIYTLLYEVTPDTDTGLTLNQKSPVLTRGVKSAIAGYYYYYTNSNSFNLADYINNTLNYSGKYTYADLHCEDVNFSSTRVFAIDPSADYVHVAAVDVAGNIGPTSTLEVGRTEVVKVTFNPDAPIHQINPVTLDGSTNPVTRYIAKDGATLPDNGKGKYENLTHLHFNNIPVVVCEGLVHTGWIDKETGTHYDTNLTGFKPDKDMTLYATYDYTTTGSLTAEYTLSKNNPAKGVTIIHGVPFGLNTQDKTETDTTTPWANNVTITIKGTDKATGLYSLNTENDLETTVYQGNKDYLTHTREVLDKLTIGENTSHVNTGTNIVTDNTSSEELLIQGTFTVSGKVVTREGNSFDTNTLSVKVDKTMPTFESFTIQKKTVKYDSVDPSDITNAIKKAITENGFAYDINVTVNDYNSTKYGAFTDKTDSSGIYGVYASFTNAGDDTDFAVYKLNCDSVTANTLTDGNILRANYLTTVNLKSRFPDATKLIYRIYAVDNAGNVTETTNLIENVFDKQGNIVIHDDIEDIPGYIEEIGHSTIFGTIANGEIITAFYSEEDGELNQLTDGELTPTGFFRTGDFGHIDIWTVGYIKTLTWDFDGLGTDIMGTEAKSEIERGQIHPQFNMGLANESEYARSISYGDTYDNLVFEIIEPDFFTIEDSGVEKKICKDASIASAVGGVVDVDKYNSLLINDDGIPYAMHVTVAIPAGKTYSENYQNKGTSMRVPPYYALAVDPDTKEYVWETHFYSVIGTFENGDTATGSGKYVLFGDKSTDVHQRVTKYYSNN